MNTKLGLAAGIVIAVIAVLFFVLSNYSTTGQVILSETIAPLKVGWMTSWTDPGLLAEALKNTDALANNNANAEMVSFSYGPPIVEAALAGKLDATFLGWVPSVNLLAKSGDWVVVGRLVYFSKFIMVRNDSNISTIAGLRGKKIGVPFATGPYPTVIQALQEVGLDAKKDVELVNIKPDDLPLALETKQVDAVAWSNPLFTSLTEKKIGKKLAEFSDVGFIMVSKKFLQENPEQVKNFLKAVKQANFFVAQNKDKVYAWYAKDASFELNFIASQPLIEPNFSAKSIDQVDLSISKELVEKVQKDIDFEFKEGIISKRVDLESKIDQNYLN